VAVGVNRGYLPSSAQTADARVVVSIVSAQFTVSGRLCAVSTRQLPASKLEA
jgi:hypothetical protein